MRRSRLVHPGTDPTDGRSAATRRCGARAPPGLCAELTEQAARRLVHLVNYRADGPIREVAVTVRVPGGRQVRAVTLASPEHDADIAVPFREENGTVRFTVPQVGIYEIAVIDLR